MERLTTAYERIWVDGRMETQYVAKEESVMEIENKLGKYEDAEEEGRLFITPCKPGDLIYEVDVIERPEWDAPNVYTSEKETRAKAEQLIRQRNRLESHTVSEPGWIPVTERLPENDSYVLMSFENFSLPLVGRYVDDEELGGAWYLGDCIDEDTCLANDLFVNAWMPLPEPYREDE